MFNISLRALSWTAATSSSTKQAAQAPQKSNEQTKTAEQENLLTNHNTSVKITHFFQQKNVWCKNAWGRRSVTPFANRKEESERHNKMSKNLIKPLNFVDLSSRKEIQICSSLNHRKKIKAEPSRPDSSKVYRNLKLLFVACSQYFHHWLHKT